MTKDTERWRRVVLPEKIIVDQANFSWERLQEKQQPNYMLWIIAFVVIIFAIFFMW